MKLSRTHWGFIALIVAGALAPLLGVYPTFLMKCWCFALFACAFNLLLGYTGLLSFGHAAFLGAAGYLTGHSIKVWGLSPELGVNLSYFVDEKGFAKKTCEMPGKGPTWVETLVVLEDKDVEFISKVGPMEFKKKFKLADMVMDGKLTL